MRNIYWIYSQNKNCVFWNDEFKNINISQRKVLHFSLSRINLLLDVFFLKYCEMNLDVDQVYDVLTNHDTTMTAPGIIYSFTTCISHCELRTSKYHAHGDIRWI